MNDKNFDGKTYDESHDQERLTSCLNRVKSILENNEWVTLEEIQSEAVRQWGKIYLITSISARIRDLRKEKFGSYIVQSRRRGDLSKGLYEYKLKN